MENPSLALNAIDTITRKLKSSQYLTWDQGGGGGGIKVSFLNNLQE